MVDSAVGWKVVMAMATAMCLARAAGEEEAGTMAMDTMDLARKSCH